ncbi:MAG: aminotransferase class I/II-fold pyridoxal phosphate-dependent enzyme, partial [Actinomycetota bacterium]|nr:aminotransferase class I/II-fold pyridoxal phosphate-dependent enzyme [Actinomycetota bacterium]
MFDFTSAHHLGWEHPSASLPSWPALTTGRPAALDEGTGADIERSLADLTGMERGIVSRSTLHAGWDVGTVLGGRDTVFLVDGGSYPTSSVAVSTAASRGSAIVPFRHHDAMALERAMRRMARPRCVVLTDGWCPGCGNAAPLADYHRAASRERGILLVDDTQAVGVLGPRGGGTVRRAGLCGCHAVAMSSLAKAFAAPLAVTTGPRAIIDRVRAGGPSRLSASPPTRA